MISFGTDNDKDDWSTMRIQFDELADFFTDFDEISDEINAVFYKLEDIQNTDIPVRSFVGFRSFYSQYKISATAEFDLSSGELGLALDGYELTISQAKNIARRENNSQKKKFYGSKLLPKQRPLCDVITSNYEVKIVAEISGVSKEDIKVRVLEGGIVNIVARKDNSTKYNRKVRIPPAQVDMDSGKSKFNNGILEITFKKKEEEGRRR